MGLPLVGFRGRGNISLGDLYNICSPISEGGLRFRNVLRLNSVIGEVALALQNERTILESSSSRFQVWKHAGWVAFK